MTSNPPEFVLVYISVGLFLVHQLTCGKRESVSYQHSMKTRRSAGAESYTQKINEGNDRGGGKDDTCDHGLYVQKMESRSVPKKKEKITAGIRDYQSAIISKEHVKYEAKQTHFSVTYQHDRLHLTGKRPQQRCQGPQQQQSTPSSENSSRGKKLKTRTMRHETNACHSLVSSVDTVDFYYDFRVVQLNNRRNDYFSLCFLCRK